MRRTVEAAIHVRARPGLVYSVLTGYGSYRDWMPDVTSSRVLAREGDIAVIELIAPPYGQRKMLLEVVESPPARLSFHEIDRLRAHGLSGSWSLEAADDQHSAVVRGRLRLKGGLLRPGSRRRLRATLDHTLDALATRCAQRAAEGADASRRRRIFALRRSADGLEISLGDEPYRAVPAPGDPAQ